MEILRERELIQTQIEELLHIVQLGSFGTSNELETITGYRGGKFQELMES
ncbi:hypothetical protein [Thermococcus peptonophilus]|nr:hypothetical protein [Thermococcus peptonophilus]